MRIGKNGYIRGFYDQSNPNNTGKTVEVFYTDEEQGTPECHDDDEETEQAPNDLTGD